MFYVFRTKGLCAMNLFFVQYRGATVEKLFPGELLSGAFFIFLNRHKDHMKVLFWDKDGIEEVCTQTNLALIKD